MVAALWEGKVLGQGEGASKKIAEIEAAAAALKSEMAQEWSKLILAGEKLAV